MRELRALKREAQLLGIVTPTPATLDKYGLTLREWLHFLDSQGWKCSICKRRSGTGKYVTDHEHVLRWASMPPSLRKIYVRGVICWFCNRWFLARSITVERAQNVTRYLEEYERRRDAQLTKGTGH